MLAAGILLCLVLVSTALVSGMLARFASGDGASDSARVASFNVTGDGFTKTVNFDVTMGPGSVLGEGAKEFSVKNQSEVAVSYTVTIRNKTNNLPLTLTVGGAEQAAFTSDEGYTYTAELAPNGATANHIFQIAWPAEQSDPVFSGMLDNIAITVTATQID